MPELEAAALISAGAKGFRVRDMRPIVNSSLTPKVVVLLKVVGARVESVTTLE
ncbi:hypothetical protein D3C81_2145120 [compost metagenome]